MKKYNTKPIDFTGCHPVIAEHLKRGESVECFVYDSPADEYKRCWVLAYYVDNNYPYRTGEEAYRYAEPIAPKARRIMPPERAIPVLIAEGWRFDHRGALRGEKMDYILPQMFEEMGKPLEDNSWKWPDCIIEEVEDDDE